MTEPHDVTPHEPEPAGAPAGRKPVVPRFGAMRFEAMESLAKRRQARRERTATQSWPEFFRSLAIEIAAIAAAVALFALVIWLWRLSLG